MRNRLAALASCCGCSSACSRVRCSTPVGRLNPLTGHAWLPAAALATWANSCSSKHLHCWNDALTQVQTNHIKPHHRTHMGPRSLNPPSPGLLQYCLGHVPHTAQALAASRSAAAASGEGSCTWVWGGDEERWVMDGHGGWA